MEEILKKIEYSLGLMGFSSVMISIDEEHRKISVVIDDDLIRREQAGFLPVFEHVVNRFLAKEKKESYVVDVNYYRRERERLITELARAAAKRAMMTKEEVRLPPMNGYERRLVHVEITTHPELTTESEGEGRDRCVIIKHLR